jgi:hypothetical protein
MVHFHGLDDGQRRAGRNFLADGNLDGNDSACHRRAHGPVVVHLTD